MGLFRKRPVVPTKDEFARMVMEGIRRVGETQRIQYDPEEFALSKEGGGVLGLHNAYIEYCGVSQEDRDKVLHAWVRSWFVFEKEAPTDYEDVCPDLLPTVRSRAFFDVTQLRMHVAGNPKAGWPYTPLGEHFAIGLVYDMHEAMRSIRQDDLDTWGVSFYEAMEVAMENLKQLPHQFIGPDEGPGVYLSANGDGYDVSRLLLLDVIRHFNLDGDPIALAPTRDTLIVTGSNDTHGLKGMLTLADDATSKQPGLVSMVALRLNGEDWEPWLPDPDHPLHNEFKLRQVGMFTEDYKAQKGLLDTLHEARGEDIFVADYNGLQDKETGKVHSYSVWGKDVLSWLPKTDLLAFVEELGGESRIHSWDRVVQAVGDMLEPLDIYPPRFKVSGYPSEEQFADMGERIVL